MRGEEGADRAPRLVLDGHPGVPEGVPGAEGAQETGEVGPGAPADAGGVAPQLVDGEAEGPRAVPDPELQVGRGRGTGAGVVRQHDAAFEQDPAAVGLVAGEPVHQPQFAERAVLVAEFRDVQRRVRAVAPPVDSSVPSPDERRGDGAPPAQRVRRLQHAVRVPPLQQAHTDAFDGREREQHRFRDVPRQHPGRRGGQPVTLGGRQRRERADEGDEPVEQEGAFPLLPQVRQSPGLQEVAHPAVRLDAPREVPARVRRGPAVDDPAAHQGDPADRGRGPGAEGGLAGSQVLVVAQPVPLQGLPAQAETGHQGVPDDQFGCVGEPGDDPGAREQGVLPGRFGFLGAVPGEPAPASGDQVGPGALAGLPEGAAGVPLEAFAVSEDEDVGAPGRRQPGVARYGGEAARGVGGQDADPFGGAPGEGPGRRAERGRGVRVQDDQRLDGAQRLAEHGLHGGPQGRRTARSRSDHTADVGAAHANAPFSIASTTRDAAVPSSRSQNDSRKRAYASRWGAVAASGSRSAPTTSAEVARSGPGARASKSKQKPRRVSR